MPGNQKQIFRCAQDKRFAVSLSKNRPFALKPVVQLDVPGSVSTCAIRKWVRQTVRL